MIAFVKGSIEDIAEDNVILDTGGIGYNIKISGQTAAALPGIGKEVKLYTYTCVREDAFLLYGFLSRDELEIFKKLITVNGIGPKGGLSILSVMSADDLRFAIMSGDAKAISKAPGIGAKTAGRVILDLKDKISLDDTLIKREMNDYAGNVPAGNSAGNEAVEALIALGYQPGDALRAVKKVNPTPEADAETILKLALKNMY
jgi:Holliday junction DNA helicase RuvA